MHEASQSSVNDITRQDALHIVDQSILSQHRPDVQREEFLIGNRKDDDIELVIRQCIHPKPRKRQKATETICDESLGRLLM